MAIAVKLHTAFEFERAADFVEDNPWAVLSSVVRNILPQLPADLATALKPCVAPKVGTRHLGDAWNAGVKAAFPAALKFVEKAKRGPSAATKKGGAK